MVSSTHIHVATHTHTFYIHDNDYDNAWYDYMQSVEKYLLRLKHIYMRLVIKKALYK